ncbi:MAG: rhomboid family intramembrane serine protease [Solobacterium sp.]|nr:rhomboid family intramembrane serine protease [Solobacterium sp.]
MKQGKDRPIVTFAVGIVCILIFAGIRFLNFASEPETAIFLGAYYKPFIIAGEFWRFLTAGFVHIDLWHILMNMLALRNLGMFMEKITGRWRYLVILLLSIIGGNVFFFIMSHQTYAVGLSGGLYGLMAGYTLLILYSGSWRDPRIMSSLISTYLINLMINFMPQVAAAAHAGGFFTGLLVTGILLPLKDKKAKYHYGFCLLLMIAAMGYLLPKNAFIDEDKIYARSDIMVLRYEKEIGLAQHAGKIAANLDTIYTVDYQIYKKVMED